MTSQIHDVWRFRGLVRTLVVRNMKVKYQKSILGFLWTLLNPLIMLSILLVVFTHVVRIPIKNYWAFLLSGYFVWNFITQVLTAGSAELPSHTMMIRNAAFPREVPVLAAALSRLLEFFIELTLVMVVITLLHHGTIPLSFLIIPVLVVLQLLLALGLTLPIAAMAVFYYDVRHMLPIILTALFYVSPIFYSVDLVPEKFKPMYIINPVAHLLETYHTVLYEGIMPSPMGLATVTLFSVGTCLLGYGIFNHFKPFFSEIV